MSEDKQMDLATALGQGQRRDRTVRQDAKLRRHHSPFQIAGRLSSLSNIAAFSHMLLELALERRARS